MGECGEKERDEVEKARGKRGVKREIEREKYEKEREKR
jgi:hypothetical protein